MDDLKVPKILEFNHREDLGKGRIRTTLRLFMLDQDVVETIAHRFAKGETSSVECRVGVTIKNPKDKTDNKVARDHAMKKLTKVRYEISRITIQKNGVVRIMITAEDCVLTISKNEKGVRIYKGYDFL